MGAFGWQTRRLRVRDRRRASVLGLRGGTPAPTGGMVFGMVTKKVTITLDEAQLDRVRELVENGKALSVSGFVQHAVGVALDDVAGWGALLAQALKETGGARSPEEETWADEMLGTQKRRTRSVA